MTRLEGLKIKQAIVRMMLSITQSLEIAELKDPNAMLTPKEQSLITAFDAATTAIGARIAALVAANTGDLTDEAQAAFQAEVDKLTALGADPSNPVPTPTPVG